MGILTFLCMTGLALVLYIVPGLVILSFIHIKGFGLGKRILLAVPLSLVAVPFLFAALSTLTHIYPTLYFLLAICAVLAGISWLINRSAHRSAVEIASRVGRDPMGILELILVPILITVLVIVFNLPRLSALWDGSSAAVIGAWDVHWHVQELTSVAWTGLPPNHYFFPDLQLAYYYWSLILPAVLVNQPFLPVSLVQALAFHSIIQAFACLSATYWMLRLNYRSKTSRLLGFLFLSIVGGMDFFIQSAYEGGENWQRSVSWLVSGNEIAGMTDRYLSTPQHLAGFFAFVLVVIILRNLRAGFGLRICLLGVLGAFLLGTSPVVFIGYVVGAMVWIILYRKIAWRIIRQFFSSATIKSRLNRTSFIKILGIGVVLILIGLCVIPQFRISASSDIHLDWNDFRVSVLEKFFNSESRKLAVVDRGLTLLGLPIVMGWVLLLEIGLPFILFVYWAMKNASHRLSRWFRVVMVFPLALLTLTFLFRDTSNANNFSRNAAIPAQLFVVLGGIYLFESPLWKKPSRKRKLAISYLLAIGIVSQMITPAVQVIISSRQSIGAVFKVDKPVTVLWFPVAALPAEFPDSLQYIFWANTSTPTNSVFLEEPVTKDDVRYRRLERIRIIHPDLIRSMDYLSQDLELLFEKDLRNLSIRYEGLTTFDLSNASTYLTTQKHTIYFVSRSGEKADLGEPVYRDEFVIIYALSKNVN